MTDVDIAFEFFGDDEEPIEVAFPDSHESGWHVGTSPFRCAWTHAGKRSAEEHVTSIVHSVVGDDEQRARILARLVTSW